MPATRKCGCVCIAPAQGAAARTHARHQPLANTEQPPPARVDAESDRLAAAVDETAEDAAAPIDARAHAARQRAAAYGVAAPAEGSGAAGAAHAHDGHEQSRAEEDVAAAAHGDDLCRLVIREEEGDDGHVDVVLIVELLVTPRSSAHQLEHPLARLVLTVSKELEPTHDDAVTGGGQETKLEPEQFDALALWVDGVRRRRDPAAGKRQRLLGHRAVVLAIDRRPRVQHQEDVAALSALQGEERLLDWAVLAPPALQVALEEHAHWRASGPVTFVSEFWRKFAHHNALRTREWAAPAIDEDDARWTKRGSTPTARVPPATGGLRGMSVVEI